MRAWRFTLLLMTGGCAAGAGWTSVPTTSAGDPVVAWLRQDAGERPCGLIYPYTALLRWSGEERSFYLFDSPRKRYFGTSDFDRFLRELDALPSGTPISISAATCGSPLAPDMPDSAWTRLLEAIRRGRHEAGDPFPLCTCESRGLRFLPRTMPHGVD